MLWRDKVPAACIDQQTTRHPKSADLSCMTLFLLCPIATASVPAIVSKPFRVLRREKETPRLGAISEIFGRGGNLENPLSGTGLAYSREVH